MGRTHKIGDLSVAKVIAKLTELGYAISIPMSSDLPYDLIADKEGRLYRVQVKTAKRYGGVLQFNASTVDWYNMVQKSYIDKIDVFVAYSPELDRCYWVPIAFGTNTTIKLRLVAAKNGQTKNIKMALDFEI